MKIPPQGRKRAWHRGGDQMKRPFCNFKSQTHTHRQPQLEILTHMCKKRELKKKCIEIEALSLGRRRRGCSRNENKKKKKLKPQQNNAKFSIA